MLALIKEKLRVIKLKKKFTRFIGLGLIPSVMLIMSACNAENSTETTGEGSESGDVIKNGAIFAQTGPASTLGKTQANYAKVLQKQLDEEGPINGKKIKIVMQDYETDDAK
jgi:branched-chain amino acid transport system substrate-binding protein